MRGIRVRVGDPYFRRREIQDAFEPRETRDEEDKKLNIKRREKEKEEEEIS